MKRYCVLLVLTVTIFLSQGCTRKFTIIPLSKDFDFSVVETYGNLYYTPVIDTRSDLDIKGKEESACSGGKTGVLHLGDKNYENPLLVEFDKHLKMALANSHLFSQILIEGGTSEVPYSFKSSLEIYHVTIDEGEAQQTQACIGGIIGAAIASTIDVTATTDIQLTGILFKGEQEVWRHTISKQITERNDYSRTKENTERSMGNAIGETCKDLITEMAKYLLSQE